MLLVALFSFIFGCSPRETNYASAAQYNAQFSATFEDPSVDIECSYVTSEELVGDINVTFAIEKGEENLKRFGKYVKKSIDSADIGVLFYQQTEYSATDKRIPRASYSYKIKIPKNLRNKDVAVIPFSDERTTSGIKAVTVDKDGYISFKGGAEIYAYAIVYNAVYKDLILIGLLLLVILIICVLVKVYCVRKDNPYVQEKKREKAIQKAKEAHKQNRALAKATKRQKEEMKKKKH